ncbi:MAG: 4Fe-4S binding protein [Polyangiaceae bacterium]|nr:4Fe-4S binding protein [Polyangiaceae bacterium]
MEPSSNSAAESKSVNTTESISEITEKIVENPNKKTCAQKASNESNNISRFRWARRVSQGVFLALFFVLLCRTTFRGSFSANADSPPTDPLAVDAFLHIDPYATLLTFLSTWTVYRASAASLIVIVLTVVFGRIFCGWICPMGTINHILGWMLPSRKGKGARRIAANRTSAKRQRVKYYILFASLAAALAGSAIGGLFDPISLLIRGMGLSVMPSGQYVVGRFYDRTAHSGVGVFELIGDGVNYVFSHTVWQAQQFHYHGGWIIGILFIAVLFMNRIIPRFWCRVLCPLGALLGILSRFSLFGLQKREHKCTNCNLCLLHCQGADSPQGGVKWRQDECHMCLNCESGCPEKALKMRFLPSRSQTETKPDIERRTAVAATAAGLVAIPVLRTTGAFGPNFDADRIRPPGSIEERDFLERCIRCGACMKVCPNNALHPAMGVGGIEALWTPIVIPRIGYCEQSCVLCAQVCPTGAINRSADIEKTGVKAVTPVKIGTAFYNHGRCLPWAMQIPCIVCEEFCPTSPKAIWVEEVEVIKRDVTPTDGGGTPSWSTVKLQRPHVDPSLCVGCGACEKVCPVVDEPAIRVSSVGENRSKTNVILLRGKPNH